MFFLVGNKWIWANGNVLSKKGDGASVVTDMGRTVVRIRNKYILQKHGNLRYVPTFPTNDEGQKEALPVYLTFFYRCAKAGTLKVRFENVDKTGFANFNSMEISEEIAETDGYVQYTGNGLWNGTGDFRLEFDGDIYMYMLVLSTDKYEALTHRYRTLFEQSERLVKISAAVFDKDENMLEETGLITTSKVSGLYAIDVDGNLKSFVGAGQDGVKIKAANIQLEGLVTANENFKILEDGSIEAKNGKFTGEIDSYKGTIGGFTIDSTSITAEGNYYGDDGSGVDKASSRFFLHSSGSGFLGFSDKNRWVGIGLNVAPSTLGVPFLSRIENSTPSNMTNYGAYINVSGAQLDNIGLLMYGDMRVNARNYHSLNGTIVIDGSDEIRVATDMKSDGSYTRYYAGVSFDPKDYDLDKVRFQVRNGLIVGVVKE